MCPEAEHEMGNSEGGGCGDCGERVRSRLCQEQGDCEGGDRPGCAPVEGMGMWNRRHWETLREGD